MLSNANGSRQPDAQGECYLQGTKLPSYLDEDYMGISPQGFNRALLQNEVSYSCGKKGYSNDRYNGGSCPVLDKKAHYDVMFLSNFVHNNLSVVDSLFCKSGIKKCKKGKDYQASHVNTYIKGGLLC